MRRILALGLTAFLALPLAACGGSDDKNAGKSATAPAAEPKTLTASEVAQLVGAGYQAAHSVHVKISGTADGEPFTLDGAFALNDGASAGEADGGNGEDTMHVVGVGDTIYLDMGEDSADPAKPWTRLTPTDTAEMAQYLHAAGQTMLSYGEPTAHALPTGTVTARAEQLGQTATTHYTLTMDLAALAGTIADGDVAKRLGALPLGLAELPGLSDEDGNALINLHAVTAADLPGLRDALVKVAAGGTVTEEIWVDGSGRPVQQADDATAADGSHHRFTTTYSGWGGATVTPPATAQLGPLDLS